MKRKKRLKTKVKVTIIIVILVLCASIGFLLWPKFAKPIGYQVTYKPRFTIQEGVLHDEIAGFQEDFPELTYNEIWINEIPVLEVYKDDNIPKKLVYVIHGLNGYKEGNGYLLSRLAQEGYYAVSYDCYGFGERYSRKIMIPEIIKKTGLDLNILNDYYLNSDFISSKDYGITSVSLGGLATYWIAVNAYVQPRIIAPAAATPDFSTIDVEYLVDFGIDNWVMDEGYLGHVQSKNILLKENPLNKIEKYLPMSIIIGHGTEDALIPYYSEIDFCNMLEQMGHEDVTICLYDNVGHYYPDGFVGRMLLKMKEVLN